MPANVAPVSFTSPQALIAPDVAAQQLALQRRQQYVDALRQQGADDINPNGGAISWTQGLAKMLAAYAGGRGQRKLDQQNAALGQAYADRLRSMFSGQDGGQPQQSAAPQYGNPTARALVGQPPQTLNLPATGQSVQLPANDTPETPPAGSPPAGGGTPDQAGTPMPAQPAQRGPWSLSGNGAQDMADYMLNPEEYGKAVISAHAPVDIAKTVQQARMAMQQGDFATAQALLANVEKQNNIPLQPGRPGAPMYDHTGRVVAISPQNIEGANPVIENGHFTGGYTAAPGAAGVVQQVAAAKATGSAAGDLVDVYNPTTHQMEKVPKSVALSGAANGQTPLAAGPPLGADKAYGVTATNSANAFQTISDGAADVPNRIYALNQMSALVADPKTVIGPGSEPWNKVRGVLGTLTGTAAPSTTNAQEFSKWANQYSARSAQELGLSGSDARVQIAIHATPNGEMTKDALRSVVPQMVGIEHAKQGYANAAVAWQQTHGPDTVQQFRTEWNKVYNPSIYTHMVQGPQAFAGWVKSLSPQQATQVRQQYIQLKQLGALPR